MQLGLEFYKAFGYSWLLLFPIGCLKSNEKYPPNANIVCFSPQFTIKALMNTAEMFQSNLHNCLSKEQAFQRAKFH